jgi:hypothetical protein
VKLLNSGGIPARASELETNKTSAFLRRKGINGGAKLIFLGLFLVPLSLGLSIVFDSPGPLFFPSLVFLIGLAQITYTLLFKDRERPQVTSPPHFANLYHNEAYLNPSSAIPLDNTRRNQTAEMVATTSVTENTTKLLE